MPTAIASRFIFRRGRSRSDRIWRARWRVLCCETFAVHCSRIRTCRRLSAHGVPRGAVGAGRASLHNCKRSTQKIDAETIDTDRADVEKTDAKRSTQQPMDPRHITALAAIVGEDSRVLTQPQIVERLSRDFYWYSPVLRKQLDGK